jgi:cytochrome c peroxidase
MGVGFTGPISEINAHGAAYEGAVTGRFSGRKPPAAAYASFSPDVHFDEEEGLFVGGQFWDGRARDLAEQAKGPFLNPVEQNGPNERYICLQVRDSNYADLFEDVFGPGSLDCDDNVDRTYDLIAEAIAAYEASSEVNPFTSKYDYYLAGRAELTEQEAWGLELFEDEGKGNCAACHPSQPGPDGSPPLFTDFTYDNLGVPANPENPFYKMPADINPAGEKWVDLGLGAIVGMTSELGKFKVPTLRNVDRRPDPDFVKAFAHNGYFKSLEDITHFYNTRDIEDWPPPEVSMNVNTEELGALGLLPEEEAAIVAFMRTLSDGYAVPER